MTLVKTIFKRDAGSCFTNVPSCPSVLRYNSLAEMLKNVCVVSAADYSYWWSVWGDCVAQALVGFKIIKTSLPGDVHIRRAFHGKVWYSAPRDIRQNLPQATTGTHPTIRSCRILTRYIDISAWCLQRGIGVRACVKLGLGATYTFCEPERRCTNVQAGTVRERGQRVRYNWYGGHRGPEQRRRI